MKFTNTMFILASSNGHLFQTVTDKWHMETLGEKGEGGHSLSKIKAGFFQRWSWCRSRKRMSLTSTILT